MFKTTVPVFFDAAHQLTDSDNLVTKACARLHGHTYHVIVNFNSIKNDRSGMIVDFKAIKDIVNILDHQFINDIFKKYQFDKEPTAENIAKFIHIQISGMYRDLTDLEVSVAEGYKGNDKSAYVRYR